MPARSGLASDHRYADPTGSSGPEPTWFGRTASEWVMRAGLANDSLSGVAVARIGPAALPKIRALADENAAWVSPAILDALDSMGDDAAEMVDVASKALSCGIEAIEKAAYFLGRRGARATAAIDPLIDSMQGMFPRLLADDFESIVSMLAQESGSELAYRPWNRQIALARIGDPAVDRIAGRREQAAREGRDGEETEFLDGLLILLWGLRERRSPDVNARRAAEFTEQLRDVSFDISRRPGAAAEDRDLLLTLANHSSTLVDYQGRELGEPCITLLRSTSQGWEKMSDAKNLWKDDKPHLPAYSFRVQAATGDRRGYGCQPPRYARFGVPRGMQKSFLFEADGLTGEFKLRIELQSPFCRHVQAIETPPFTLR